MSESLVIRAAIIDELSGPLDRIEKELTKLASKLEKVDSASKRGSTSTGQLGKAHEAAQAAATKHGVAHTGLTKAMESTDKAAKRLVTGAGRNLLQFFKRGVQGAAGLAAALVVLGTKSALNLQDAKIALTNTTGSAGASQALLNNLRKESATKLFGPNTTADQAAALGSFGIKTPDLIPTIRALSDAAFLRGGKGAEERFGRIALALGQVQSKGKIQAEEALQFAEAGVPIYEKLAAKIGVTQAQLYKLLSTPSGSAGVFAKIGGGAGLAQIIGSGNAQGASDRALKGSLSAQLKSIKNQFFGAVAVGALPSIDRITKNVNGKGSQLDKFFTTVEKLVAKTLPKAIDGVGRFFTENGPEIRSTVLELGRGIGAFARALTPATIQLLKDAAMNALTLLKVFTAVMRVLTFIAPAITLVVKALSPLFTILDKIGGAAHKIGVALGISDRTAAEKASDNRKPKGPAPYDGRVNVRAVPPAIRVTSQASGSGVTIEQSNQFGSDVTREQVKRIAGEQAGKAFDMREQSRRER